MARRKTSRVTAAVLAAVGTVALGAWLLKGPAKPSGTDELLASQEGPRLEQVAGQIAQQWPTATLVRHDAPTTAPSKPIAAAPATKPAAAVSQTDAEMLFRQATQARDGGDLVTARDLVNDALVNDRLSASDALAAKTFVAQLNEKIILGTTRASADPYNKTWKVEPGTALVKLAKRFDVTAELLCKVNGLSSPHKLRAGATIKAIQGPFHLVVSKSKFEADVYLGDAGGPNAMYVKTFRVGLGSDNSTPTGVWVVDTGKVTDPIYYSPRGEGVIAGSDPKNPLGERWLPLKGVEGGAVGQESYGIHGTIDPSSIGRNMSMGCIRLQHEDIVQLYDLLVEGKSKVRVVD